MKFPWYIWIPRILMVLLMIFMALFSFDVFEMKASIWQKLGGFVIHNIPVLVLLAILLLTWRRPLLGGFFFILAAILFMLFIVGFKSQFFLVDFVSFALPMLIAATLFILAHYNRREPEQPPETGEKPD